MKIGCYRALTVLTLVAMTGVSFAAPPKMGGPDKMDKMGGGPNGPRMGGRMGGSRMMERMSKELGLSTIQKAKLKTMMESSMKQRRALRENTSMTPEQRMSKMRAMREQSMKQMQAVLTPAQRKKWQAMRKEMMERRRDRMDQMGGKMDKKKAM